MLGIHGYEYKLEIDYIDIDIYIKNEFASSYQ